MSTRTVFGQFVNVNGLTLHYVDWGNETAPPIVMLHGLRGQARTWDGLAQALCEKYHVIAVDQRGRGESQWSSEASYTIADYISDLEGILAAASIDRFVLIGHSMGGRVSLAFADAHPDTIRALVIEDSGPPGPQPSPGTLKTGSELVATPIDFDSWDSAREFCKQERPGISEEALQDRSSHTLKELPNGRITWKYDLDGIRRTRVAQAPATARDAAWNGLRALRCPTLVLHGANSDNLLPDVAKAMAEANPLVRVVDVPGAGHFVHNDNPAFFNSQVIRFLGEIA